jgi:hypothetical protein
MRGGMHLVGALVAWTLIQIAVAAPGSEDLPLPPFGRDTVLVWKTISPPEAGNLVVRIAEFLPDRYLEWESTVTQGTIFMPSRAVETARVFLSSRLFEGGVDTRGNDATTLWLSRWMFDELKAKGKAKLAIDAIDGWMTVDGQDKIAVEVNRASVDLAVVRVKDDRGAERWFLNDPANALMVRHKVRTYDSVLVSITTDRKNTLRWIKGRKLANPPH